MRQISRPTALGLIAVAAVIAVLDGEAAWRAARAEAILGIDASIVAVSIPGASTIGQIGTFLSTGTLTPGNCANPMPIPKNFPTPCPARCLIRTVSWSAADRISARSCPPAAG